MLGLVNPKGTGKEGTTMKTWLDKINEDADELGTTVDEFSTRSKSRLVCKRTIAALWVPENLSKREDDDDDDDELRYWYTFLRRLMNHAAGWLHDFTHRG